LVSMSEGSFRSLFSAVPQMWVAGMEDHREKLGHNIHSLGGVSNLALPNHFTAIFSPKYVFQCSFRFPFTVFKELVTSTFLANLAVVETLSQERICGTKDISEHFHPCVIHVDVCIHYI